MQNTKLNVLIYPMLSVDNLNADSNYIIIMSQLYYPLEPNQFNSTDISDYTTNLQNFNTPNLIY